MSSRYQPISLASLREAYEAESNLERIGTRFDISAETVRRIANGQGYARTRVEATRMGRRSDERAKEVRSVYARCMCMTMTARIVGVTRKTVQSIIGTGAPGENQRRVWNSDLSPQGRERMDRIEVVVRLRYQDYLSTEEIARRIQRSTVVVNRLLKTPLALALRDVVYRGGHRRAHHIKTLRSLGVSEARINRLKDLS